VAAQILNVSSGPNNTTVFRVQHHFVTDTGDTTTLDPATATQVAPGFYAILDYPLHITGGTGKYAGATGDINNIGAVDFGAGHTVFRYTGQVCFAGPAKPSM
jgi:hypothetical protein